MSKQKTPNFDIQKLKDLATSYSPELEKYFAKPNPAVRHIANCAMCCLTMAMDYLISLNNLPEDVLKETPKAN